MAREISGLNLTIRTIAGISLRKAFQNESHLERYWDESGTTARVSGWLAKQLRKSCWVRPEDAYTFGLFHDCGIPVIMSPFPQYRTILAKANTEKSERFTDVEDRLIGTNHADMGRMLAESWSLPSEMIDGIRYHHHLDVLVSDKLLEVSTLAIPLIAITQLAEHLIYMRTNSGNTFEWDKTSEIAKHILKVDDSMINELFENCHEPMSGFFD